MSVYEVVKLVGMCVGLILGAIVLFVVFFRTMAWIDLWVKSKTGAERSRPKNKVKKGQTGMNRSAPKLRIDKLGKPKRANILLDRTAPTQLRNGAIREQRENRETRIYGAIDGAQTSIESSAKNLETTDFRTRAIELATTCEPDSKPPNRIATVQLISGETIERVSFCSKEKAFKICEGLGFTGIVLENDDGQISVVRENNIKLVTWKVGSL